MCETHYPTLTLSRWLVSWYRVWSISQNLPTKRFPVGEKATVQLYPWL